ncbi:MAG: gamma-glutamylcyclotransferase [Bacteroidetes bacterium]|nr:gamma-glutamylcyclotransferase [Bacteroidota bacterium]MBS1756349.1 gamma-glutamylcyclotransferase [Bacteroidota bacterium]
MSAPTFNLFVYGSLRSGFRNPAYGYLTQYFKLQGDAIVKGNFYDNGSYPVAIPTAEDFFINGELYQIINPDEFSWAINQLDDYEGLNVEEGETPLYRRELADVYVEGKQTKAWIYWYNHPVEGMQLIKTGDVLKYLQEKNRP